MNRTAAVAAGAAAALLAWRAARRRGRALDLRDHAALITGGSRGLGYVLARQLGEQGCRIAFCARRQAEVDRACHALEGAGIEVMGIACDVTRQSDVDALIARVEQRFGRIDILFNNAGVIQVGPLESMTVEDFEEALNVMFWGTVYPTLAALRGMMARGYGHIVNITSIGGKVAVPHLLPYNCAKFAAVGFSQGLTAELLGTGVRVVTIAPGMMRTGSYLNAYFKGRQEEESAWFSLGATLPLISMSAERAARQIVDAVRRGESEKILSLPATLLARMYGLFPGATTEALGALARVLLPRAEGGADTSVRGRHVQPEWIRPMTALGRAAAERYHQTPVEEVPGGVRP